MGKFRKGQVMSLESYIAIVIIMVVITGFYFIMVAKENEDASEVKDLNAGIETDKIVSHDILVDKSIDIDEMSILASKDCDELKKLFEVDKKICIYFEDKNNNTIRIGNATGLGCPGLNISGITCGNASSFLTPIIPTPPSSPLATDYFISKWKTTIAAETVTLPLYNGGNYDFEVNWGDGSANDIITTWNSPSATHTYLSPGDHTINISGTIEGFRFNNAGDKNKIIEVSQWGILRLGNLGNYFHGCSNFDITATDRPDLTGTTTLSNMFNGATLLNGNIDNWEVSGINNMSYMFKDASSFNQPLNNWNTGSVTDMSRMFNDAYVFNQDIDNWDVSLVTNMEGLFLDARAFNQDIGSWDVSAVVNMEKMFEAAWDFNGDILCWDVSNVTTMKEMFKNAFDFDRDLSCWDVCGVIDSTDYDLGVISWAGAMRPDFGLATCDGSIGTCGCGAPLDFCVFQAAGVDYPGEVCSECDGFGAVVFKSIDAECGTIDCSGWYNKSGILGVSTIEHCYSKTDISTNQCFARNDCKDANSIDCDLQADLTLEYSCGICQYINSSNCDNSTKGQCSNYPMSTDVTTQNCTMCDGLGGTTMPPDDADCGLIDCSGWYNKTGVISPATLQECHSKKDISLNRCEGVDNCKDANTKDCDLQPDLALEYSCGICEYIDSSDCIGSNVGSCTNYNNNINVPGQVCTACDGTGGTKMPADDFSCGIIDCSGRYKQTGIESSSETEYCHSKENITSNRCEGIGNCRDANTADCDTQPDFSLEYICEDCQYISATNCVAGTLGSCSNYANGIDVSGETCTVCNGAGGKTYPVDDTGCPVIGCSGYYEQTGTEGVEGLETCYNKNDITNTRCEGVDNCKEASDCPAQSNKNVQYSCGDCQYISASDCAGTTKGSCSNYASGTNVPTELCTHCNGAGGKQAAADDAGCGTIDCDGNDYYFVSGASSATGTNYRYLRNYDDITSNRCEGINDCKDANTADCTDYTDDLIDSCGTCTYATTTGCTNYVKGEACTSGACDGVGRCVYWYTGAWSGCSVTCGGGVKTRTVECRIVGTTTVVADSLCTGAKPTTTSAPCNTGSCCTPFSQNFAHSDQSKTCNTHCANNGHPCLSASITFSVPSPSHTWSYSGAGYCGFSKPGQAAHPPGNYQSLSSYSATCTCGNTC